MIIVITVVVVFSLSHDILLFVLNKKIMYFAFSSASLRRKKRLYFKWKSKVTRFRIEFFNFLYVLL